MTRLQKTIEQKAFEFAQAVVAALRSASLDELTRLANGRVVRGASAVPAPSRARAGRLARRSAEDIARMLDQIEAVLRAHPEGLRAEQIRAELGVEAKEMPRPLKDGLAGGRLVVRSGTKRSTTYAVVDGATSASERPAARGPKKKRGRSKG